MRRSTNAPSGVKWVSQARKAQVKPHRLKGELAMMTKAETKKLREGLEKWLSDNEDRLDNGTTDTTSSEVQGVINELADAEKRESIEMLVRITLDLRPDDDSATDMIERMFNEAEGSDCFGENWVKGEIVGKASDHTISKKRKR